MLERLLPRCADNAYQGHKLALWIFALVVFMRAGMSLGSLFGGYAIATGPDGIPLETDAPAAAQAFVSVFAMLGLASLVISMMCAVVLARYRSLVPLMFLALLVQVVGGRIILWFLPIARKGTPAAFYINLALIVIMVVGLALALRRSEPQTSHLVPKT